MPNTKGPCLKDSRDLHTTHVFINALRAAYQGLYIYLTAIGGLSGADMAQQLDETGRQLDLIHRWWADLREKKALAGVDQLPHLTADCKVAWEMLHAVQLRYQQLSDRLGSKEHLDGLLNDLETLHLRVAVHCEHAYARQHFIDGLIEYGKIMGDDAVMSTYAQHVASCDEEVRRVNGCVADVMEMFDVLNAARVRDIFDETLTLPGILTQKVADMNEIFGRHQGGFDFQQTGIPSGQITDWKFYDFTPSAACQWYLAGFPPATAYAWTLVGLTNPVEALHYELRQFDVNAAMPWWRNHINGRTAAAWRASGYTAEQALAYRGRGIGHPGLIPQVHASAI